MTIVIDSGSDVNTGFARYYKRDSFMRCSFALLIMFGRSVSGLVSKASLNVARGFRRTPALSMALETMEGIRNVAIVAVRCCTLSLACRVWVAGAVSAVDAGSAPAAFGVGSGRGVGDAASGDEPADR